MGCAKRSTAVTEDMIEIYRRFATGTLGRARAKDLLGEHWEETAQIASIRDAQEANEEGGYSADELSQIFS
ncbi:hypothetical protein Nmn1133_14110 [Halosegnis longus]|uniref:Uncharacterized protein n=1 Tax=Halosegnis longus TaxID=2216012 RepID=A0AAJ4R641_9EURY|nr:hypothetical protein Nmn1133_14110 [Salella cibi]